MEADGEAAGVGERRVSTGCARGDVLGAEEQVDAGEDDDEGIEEPGEDAHDEKGTPTRSGMREKR
eukprot:8622482-Pyramimonas_sp.AAC.1